MKLTLEHVRHVATLARLKLSADEEARLATRLSAVLEAVDTLAELDVADVPPSTWVVNVEQVARTDEPRDMLSADEALANAPQRVGQAFAIPKVIE